MESVKLYVGQVPSAGELQQSTSIPLIQQANTLPVEVRTLRLKPLIRPTGPHTSCPTDAWSRSS